MESYRTQGTLLAASLSLILALSMGLVTDAPSGSGLTAQVLSSDTSLTTTPFMTTTDAASTNTATTDTTTTETYDVTTTETTVRTEVTAETPTASIPTTTTDTTTSDHELTTTDATYPHCPFTASKGRTIIDLTRGGAIAPLELMLVSHLTRRDAEHVLPFMLETGTYEVRLASKDMERTDTLHEEPNEVWYLALYDSAGALLARSNTTRDLTLTESKAIELVDKSLTIAKPVAKVAAVHGAYPSRQVNAFLPLCAALDKVVLEEEPIVVAPAPRETYVACPLPKREDRVIVDYTKGGTVPVDTLLLRSDLVEAAAGTVSLPAYLKPGMYDVRFASHVLPGAVRTSRESWRAELFDMNGVRVAETAVGADVPDWEQTFASKLAVPLTVAHNIVRVVARHAAYPSQEQNSVAALCISFDRVGDVSGTSVAVPEQTMDQGETVPTVYRAPVPNTTTIAPPQSVAPAVPDTTSSPLGLPIPTDVRVTRRAIVADDGVLFETLLGTTTQQRIRIAAELNSNVSADMFVRRVDTSPSVSADDPLGEEIERKRSALRARVGADVRIDTDGDGIADYDEAHLYGTDPQNRFTAGTALTDGERVLLGLDPQAPSAYPVMVGSPQGKEDTAEGAFTLDELRLVEDGPDPRILVKGSAPPLSFVTLYLFSTPIVVTVRADEVGRFEYELDTTLEDGSHEVYVASVDSGGKILAQSSAIPFVKTAQAIEFTPALSVERVDPVTSSRNTLLALFAMIFLAGVTTALLWIGGLGKHMEVENSR